MGLILIDEGSCEEGIRELKKVLEINPNYEDAMYGLGDAYYDCKKINDAIEVWKTLLKNNPNDSILHYNLGVAYRDKGQLNPAISEVEKAIASNPKDVDAINLLNQLGTKKKGVKRSSKVKNKKKTENKK